MAYIRIAWNDKSTTCNCMHNCFCFVFWSRLAERSVQSYEEWSFLNIFSCFGPFPQVLGQVKEYFLLELHEMIRVSHAVVCTMGFNLLFDRGQQGGGLKPTKNNNFQVFLTVWVLLLRFLGRLRSEIYWNNMKK